MGLKARARRPCTICSKLADREFAQQKYGWEDWDTQLPKIAQRLRRVLDLGGTYSRRNELRRCPQCGTYYHYWEDYEFLANGTEDEQCLVRLRPDEAEALRAGRAR